MWRHFLCLPLLLVAAHGCGEVSPRAEIICYNNGDAHLSTLDPCKCTILTETNVELDADLKLTSETDFTKLLELKKTNPSLKLVASLGGSNVKAETFSHVTSSVEGIANFTEGLVSFVSTNELDGIEIDWRWPGQNGGRKDIEDVTTLMKVVRLALDQRVHSVSRREAEVSEGDSTTIESSTLITDATEIIPTTILTESPQEEEDTTEQNVNMTEPATFSSTEATNATDEALNETLITEAPLSESNDTASFFDYFTSFFSDYFPDYFTEDYSNDYAYYYDDEDYEESNDIFATTTILPENENLGSDYLVLETGSEYEVTVQPTEQPSEDYFKVSNLPTTSTVTSTTTPSPLATSIRPKSSPSGGWKFSKSSKNGGSSNRAHRRPVSVRKTPSTILMMTLAPYPEYIVKGYDLKALAKIVDLFSLPTHNLTERSTADHPRETFHHSRLMGVSDLQNADSIVDLVVSLGIPLDRLILGMPSSTAIFALEDAELNTPRSPAVSVPQIASYRKACTEMSSGNWTVERDEDLTGPYAFLNDTWIAFDDPTSIKIKSKYVLLRGMAGAAIHDLAQEDYDDSCGQGSYPLLSSVYDTFTQLARTPRRAVLQSLVNDLEAEESSFSSVSRSASGDLRNSPYRIVRIVDRTGAITAVRASSGSRFECSRQGYYRDPADCSQFYRCVKFDQYVDDFTVFEYSCPPGLVFDDRWEICAWPSAAPPCDGSSEIFPVPRRKFSCPGEGYFTDPENCRWFFACRDYYGNGSYVQYEFRCPFGLAYDEDNGICNWPWLVGSCGHTGPIPGNYEDVDFNASPVSIQTLTGVDFGQGKSIVGGGFPAQNLHSGSSESCEECGSIEVAIGGKGVYSPERGIIVSPSRNGGRLSYNNYKNTGKASISANRGKQTGSLAYGSASPSSRRPSSGHGSGSRGSASQGSSQGYNYQAPSRPTTIGYDYNAPSTASVPSAPRPTTPSYGYEEPDSFYNPSHSASSEESDLFNPSGGYSYQEPDVPFSPASTVRPSGNYSPPRPSQSYGSPTTRPSTSYGKPSTSRPSGTYSPPRPSQSSRPSGTYSPPRPSQSTARPSGSYSPPRPSTSYNRPSPTTPQTPSGYSYEEPSTSFNPAPSPSRPASGYDYSEPSKPFNEVSIPQSQPSPSYSAPAPSSRPPSGYHYGEPSISFDPVPSSPSSKPSPSYSAPSPSPTYSSPTTPAPRPSPSYSAPSPSPTYSSPTTPVAKPSSGYSYQAPSTPFNSFSTPSPSYSEPRPAPSSNPSRKPSTGYSYPEPSTSFNPTSSGSSSRPSSKVTTTSLGSSGYSYPQPSTSFDPFSSGASSPTFESSSEESQESGYDYSPPRRPTTSIEVPTNGYSYPEPSRPFNPLSPSGSVSSSSSSSYQPPEAPKFVPPPSTSYLPVPAPSPSPAATYKPSRRPRPTPPPTYKPAAKPTSSPTYTPPQRPTVSSTYKPAPRPTTPTPSYSAPSVTESSSGYSYPEPSKPFSATSSSSSSVESSEGYAYEPPSKPFNPFASAGNSGKTIKSRPQLSGNSNVVSHFGITSDEAGRNSGSHSGRKGVKGSQSHFSSGSSGSSSSLSHFGGSRGSYTSGESGSSESFNQFGSNHGSSSSHFSSSKGSFGSDQSRSKGSGIGSLSSHFGSSHGSTSSNESGSKESSGHFGGNRGSGSAAHFGGSQGSSGHFGGSQGSSAHFGGSQGSSAHFGNSQGSKHFGSSSSRSKSSGHFGVSSSSGNSGKTTSGGNRHFGSSTGAKAGNVGSFTHFGGSSESSSESGSRKSSSSSRFGSGHGSGSNSFGSFGSTSGASNRKASGSKNALEHFGLSSGSRGTGTSGSSTFGSGATFGKNHGFESSREASGESSKHFGGNGSRGGATSGHFGGSKSSRNRGNSESNRGLGHFGSAGHDSRNGGESGGRKSFGHFGSSSSTEKSGSSERFGNLGSFGKGSSSENRGAFGHFGSNGGSGGFSASKSSGSSSLASSSHFGKSGREGSGNRGAGQLGGSGVSRNYGKSRPRPSGGSSSGIGARKSLAGGPSLVAKLTRKRKFQRFGPGGVRDFDDTLGPEVCERAGLFRHPDTCDKFYECYWDKWVERFTLHVFDCPITIVYDSGITACNWPFNGPPCHDSRHA